MITEQLMPAVAGRQNHLEQTMKDSVEEVKWAEEKSRVEEPCDTNVQAKVAEELAKRALELKKKELKWKLMQASQAKNQEKLKEIHIAVNYHRRKLSKAQDLAAKLREKYVKVYKSARLTETQFKKAELQLSQQERFVADEKMQLTKLARDCIQTGSTLFGDTYKLPSNPIAQGNIKMPDQPQARVNGESSRPTDKRDTATATILEKLSPFLRNARLNANQLSDTSKRATLAKAPTTRSSDPSCGPIKRPKRAQNPKLSSIYPDLNDGILKNLASYRLTSKFAELGSMLTDLTYSHNLSPLEYVCLPDLLGECSDKSCRYQHKSNYQMTDLERLADLLSYRPQVTGFKPDSDLSQEENMKICRVKVKQYAARLISRNPNKSVEMIARILVKKIRADLTDAELIIMPRQLPKESHLKRVPLKKCSCEPIDISSENENLSGPPHDEVKIKLEPMDFD